MKHEDKQFYFTLDKGNGVEKYVYEKIKADGALNLRGTIYNSNYQELDVTLTNTINENTFDLSEDDKTYEAGDIVISFNGVYSYLRFLYEQKSYSYYQKVGEIEKSSLDGFRSLCNGVSTGTAINVIFTLKEFEQSESILKKIIVIIVVVISLTLFYIIYLLIQF